MDETRAALNKAAEEYQSEHPEANYYEMMGFKQGWLKGYLFRIAEVSK